jgi:hypothetical protein
VQRSAVVHGVFTADTETGVHAQCSELYPLYAHHMVFGFEKKR